MRTASLGLLLFVAACGDAAPPPRAATPPPPPAARPTTAPGVASAPVPPASAEPAALPVPAPTGPTPFFLAARTPPDVRMMSVVGATFFVAGPATLFELAGDEIRLSADRFEGLEPGFELATLASIAAIAGRWPDAAFAYVTLPLTKDGGTNEHPWTGTKWGPRKGLLVMSPSGLPLPDGRTLAHGSEPIYGQPTVALLPWVQLAGGYSADMAACTDPYAPESVGVTTDGTALMAGLRCTSGKPTADRVLVAWPATGPSVTHPLTVEPIALAGRSASDVWMIRAEAGPSGPRPTRDLLHFDGKTIRSEPTPLRKPIEAIVVDGEGALWIVEPPRSRDAPSVLWRRSPDGRWTVVAMPVVDGTPVVPTALWSRPGGELWVTGFAGDQDVLLRNRPVARVATIPSVPPTELRRLQPAPPDCDAPVVLLERVASAAAPDSAPLARALGALAARKVAAAFEVHYRDATYLAADQPTLRQAKSLAAAVGRLPPSAAPSVVCGNPGRSGRTFELDEGTRKWTATTAPATPP